MFKFLKRAATAFATAAMLVTPAMAQERPVHNLVAAHENVITDCAGVWSVVENGAQTGEVTPTMISCSKTLATFQNSATNNVIGIIEGFRDNEMIVPPPILNDIEAIAKKVKDLCVTKINNYSAGKENLSTQERVFTLTALTYDCLVYAVLPLSQGLEALVLNGMPDTNLDMQHFVDKMHQQGLPKPQHVYDFLVAGSCNSAALGEQIPVKLNDNQLAAHPTYEEDENACLEHGKRVFNPS